MPDVTCTVSVKVPDAVAVTFTVKVHDPDFGIAAALRAMLALPAMVTAPPQELDGLAVAAMVMPAGRVSTKATPERFAGLAAGFAMLNVNVDVPLTGMVAGLKVKAIAGGAMTVRTAEAVFPVPPSVDVTWAVFVKLPGAPAKILTAKVQDAAGAREPPARLMACVPATAVTVPPQDPVTFAGFAIAIPAGSVSVTPRPVREPELDAGFEIVKVRETAPFSGAERLPNARVSDGGFSVSFSVWVAAVNVPATAVMVGAAVLSE